MSAVWCTQDPCFEYVPMPTGAVVMSHFVFYSSQSMKHDIMGLSTNISAPIAPPRRGEENTWAAFDPRLQQCVGKPFSVVQQLCVKPLLEKPAVVHIHGGINLMHVLLLRHPISLCISNSWTTVKSTIAKGKVMQHCRVTIHQLAMVLMVRFGVQRHSFDEEHRFVWWYEDDEVKTCVRLLRALRVDKRFIPYCRVSVETNSRAFVGA